ASQDDDAVCRILDPAQRARSDSPDGAPHDGNGGDSMKRLLLLLALVGCDEGLTSVPEPAVAVLKETEAGCFALMTPDPIAPALNIPDVCTDPDPPRLCGGDDHVQVVIDYGSDVDFAGATDAPKPTVTVTIDGAVADVPIEVSEEHRVGGRVFFIATFVAPKQPSLDMQIS